MAQMIEFTVEEQQAIRAGLCLRLRHQVLDYEVMEELWPESYRATFAASIRASLSALLKNPIYDGDCGIADCEWPESLGITMQEGYPVDAPAPGLASAELDRRERKQVA